MTPELILQRDSELERLRRGYGRARLIGKSGEIGYANGAAAIDRAGIDRGQMSVPCTITTEAEDNSLDIIITDGIDLAIHAANPVVKFDHGQSLTIPIGKAQGPDGVYSVTKMPGLLKAVTFFSQTNLEAEQIFQLCEEGILNGVSIGAIPIPDKIEKRAVLNWKGMPGMVVRGCRLFEYSHTPSPDNPQALTDRVMGGRALAGKSISGALLKSFEPYLIAQPDRVSVPAFAAELVKELQKGGLAMIKKDGDPAKDKDGYQPVQQQDGAAQQKSDGQQAPPSKEEPKKDEPKPEEKSDTEDPMKDYPPGAKAVAGLHDRVNELLAFIGDSVKGQENPAVKELLADMTDEIAERCDGLKSFFKDNYGDFGELKSADPEDADDKPAPTPTEKTLRKTRRYVLPYRKSILAGVPAANARDEKAEKLAAENVKLSDDAAKLRKALEKSLDDYDRLKKAFDKARMGR